MSRIHRHCILGTTTLLAAILVAGCGGASDDAADDPSAAGTTSSPTTSPSGPRSTPELDSMVVLGHSGTTGFGSDPTQPDVDVRENSWATGSNPEVRSVYQRLVATHPALEGHATSVGVDGSFVEDLGAQVQTLLFQDPLPDLGDHPDHRQRHQV